MSAPAEIRGAGGKGGGHAATEAADSLRSTQYAEVLDLVSEGEIQGLVNGLKSVYLDKVPVQAQDGTMNFDGVQFAWTVGTQGQAALPGFSTVQTEQAVDVEATAGTPIVRTITNAAVDTVRVTIGIPQLTFQSPDSGDITGTEVAFAIDIQSNGGGYVQVYATTVSGKTTTRYQRAVRLALEGDAPWDVRVRRVSPAPSGSNTQNAVWWDSYAEIQTLKLRYPNSAIHALRVSAQAFSQVPTRAYEVMGIRCQVPANYDAYLLTYTGTWDGTFKISWTNNPAWVLYDLITNERYGLGDYVDAALLDKWKLYEIAQYCDELVPNGFGGMEPRFTCNVVLQTRAEAYQVLQDLAAVFRGMIFWAASAVQFAQDAPADAEMLFVPGNVVDGLFTYASTSQKTRHSTALVWWNNPNDFFNRVPEVVPDEAAIARYGLRELELSPLGVTSRGQANRIGRWALYSEQMEAETVTFRTGLEGAGTRPGALFKIADPSEAGERLGGRVKAATTTAVTLDAAVTLAAGESYTLTVMRPSPDAQERYVTEERAVTTAAGATSVVTVSPGFTVAPEGQDIWVLASTGVASTWWRCLSVKESGKEFEVVGVAHNPGKFDAIELGLVLEQRPTSRLTSAAVKPAGLTFHETLYIERSSYKSRVTVGWVPPANLSAGLQRYRVTWRHQLGPLNAMADTAEQSIEILGLEPGLLEISVRAVNALGNVSPPLEGSMTVLGKLAPPENFDTFTLTVQPDGTREFRFAYVDTPRPVDFKGAQIRYIEGLVGTPAWETMKRFDDQPDQGFYPQSPVETNQLLAGDYTFAICALDETWVPSATPLYIEATLPDRRRGNILVEFAEEADNWPGTCASCHVAFGRIVEADDTSSTWATLPSTWDAWTRWNLHPASPITYTSQARDLGAVITAQLNTKIDADGTVLQEMRSSVDGTTWTAWGSAGASFTGQYLQVRVTVTATVGEPVPTIRSWQYAVTTDLKKEYIDDISPAALTSPWRIGTGDIRVPLANTYSVVNVRSVVIQDSRSGTWSWALLDKNTSGPRLQFRLNATLTDPALVDIYVEGI